MRRFLQEARITAGLEHPNIVPVYELAYRDDGTLYYTMKLVRGLTLADALAQQRGMDDRLRLLGHVVDVCQATAFAHSHGVIHRDLKPGNVMVGEFGETVVLDWGLAKRRGDGDVDGLSAGSNDAGGGESSGLTLDDGAMGTPAYMSPEQAAGDPARIDERTDVFALGVMLFELLTGATPFGGGQPMAVITRVMREPAPPVATVMDKVPKELAAIIDRALQHAPEDRYPSAKELAADLVAFQSGRRVGAYDYSLWTLVKRFGARHKAAVAVAAVAVLLLAVLGALSVDRIVDERDRARSQRNAARAFAGYLLYDIGDALEALPGSSPLREQLVNRALAYYETDAGEGQTAAEQRDKAMAWSKIGLAALELSKTGEARKAMDRAEAMVRGLAVDPSYPAVQQKHDLEIVLQGQARRAARAGELGAAVDMLREARELGEAVVAALPEDTQGLQNLAVTYDLLGDALAERDALGPASEAYRAGALVEQRVLAREPGHVDALRGVAVTDYKLARMATARGEVAVAEEHLRAAVKATRERLAGRPGHAADKDDLALLLSSLGELLSEQARLAEALELFRAALPLSEDVAASDPSNATYQQNLATRLGELARIEGALGDRDGRAAGYVSRAHGLLERNFAADPADALARHDLALSHRQLGHAAESAGDIEAAGRHYAQAHELAARLVAEDPSSVDFQQILLAATDDLGDVAAAAGEPAKARELYERSVAGRERLRAAAPESIEHPRDLAVSRVKLGMLAHREGRLADARIEYSQAVMLRSDVVAAAPDAVDAQTALAKAYEYLARASYDEGQYAESLDISDRALEISERLMAALEPDQRKRRGELLLAYRQRADLAHAVGQPGRAEGYLRRMGALADELRLEWPNETDFWAYASLAHGTQGEHFEQLQLVEQMLAADPASTSLLADQVESLVLMGRFQEAIALAPEAIARIREAAPAAVPAVRAWLASAYALAGLPETAAMVAREAAREMRALGGQPLFWAYFGVRASLGRFAQTPGAAQVIALIEALDRSRSVGGEAAAAALEAFAEAL